MLARLLIDSDIPQILKLAEAHAREITPGHEFSPERALVTYNRYRNDGNGIHFVAEEGRDIVGYIGAYISDYPYTVGHAVVLDVIYVKPECRGSRAAALLMTRFTEWADRVKPLETFFRTGNSGMSPKLSAFFQRYGFTPVGSVLRR